MCPYKGGIAWGHGMPCPYDTRRKMENPNAEVLWS